MVEYKTIIDNKNNIVQECVLFIDGIAKDYIIKGNQIIVEFLNKTYIKPQWDFDNKKWMEGATDEEIKEHEEESTPMPKEPSETDLLKIELAENTKDLAKKDLEIEQLQKDIADITKQLAVGGNI
ncbi:hypothetical protein FDB41_12615 [Clostridium botulinum]|nr:hypothetical protein [Clostridium botulinum]NFO54371.1 hypothetical protein [Clostridium botulinum]